jgi:hypothetical protein
MSLMQLMPLKCRSCNLFAVLTAKLEMRTIATLEHVISLSSKAERGQVDVGRRHKLSLASLTRPSEALW